MRRCSILSLFFFRPLPTQRSSYFCGAQAVSCGSSCARIHDTLHACNMFFSIFGEHSEKQPIGVICQDSFQRYCQHESNQTGKAESISHRTNSRRTISALLLVAWSCDFCNAPVCCKWLGKVTSFENGIVLSTNGSTCEQNQPIGIFRTERMPTNPLI